MLCPDGAPPLPQSARFAGAFPTWGKACLSVRVLRRRTRLYAAEKGRESRARFGVSSEDLVCGVCRSAPCAVCFAAGGSLRRSSRLAGTMRLWQVGLPRFRTSGLSDRRSSFTASCKTNSVLQPASRTGRPQRWEFEQRLAPDFTFPAHVRAKTNSSQRTSAYFPHGAATFILTGFHRITFKPLSCVVRCWSTSNNLPAGEGAV